MPYISPEQYPAASAYDLLDAAAAGSIGFDQRLIHALVDDPQRTLPDILRFIEDAEFPPELRVDLVLLLRHLNPPEAAAYYIKALEEEIADVPEELVEAIIAIGEPMLERLLSLYDRVDEADTGEIAFLLASLGVRDARVLHILLELLEYDAAEGALALGIYGDPAGIPDLERILAEVHHSDKQLRHAIETAISDIREFANRKDEPQPFDIFDYYPEQAGPEFDLLSEEERLALLSDAPADVRRDAAASFRNAELTPPLRDRLLQVATTDADPEVRGQAWESLANVDDDPEIGTAMLRAAREGAPEERAGAVVALASGHDVNEEKLQLIQELYEIPEVRDKALEAMWKSLDRRFQPAIVRHLADPDISPNAILGVGYLGISSEANRLVAWFDDPDLRTYALMAYALATPTEVSRGRMKPLLRRIDQLAHGLHGPEEALVKEALDQRLQMHGLKPVFGFDVDEPSEMEDAAPAAVRTSPAKSAKVGRNDPCPCGSGKKFKKCHGA